MIWVRVQFWEYFGDSGSISGVNIRPVVRSNFLSFPKLYYIYFENQKRHVFLYHSYFSHFKNIFTLKFKQQTVKNKMTSYIWRWNISSLSMYFRLDFRPSKTLLRPNRLQSTSSAIVILQRYKKLPHLRSIPRWSCRPVCISHDFRASGASRFCPDLHTLQSGLLSPLYSCLDHQPLCLHASGCWRGIPAHTGPLWSLCTPACHTGAGSLWALLRTEPRQKQFHVDVIVFIID